MAPEGCVSPTAGGDLPATAGPTRSEQSDGRAYRVRWAVRGHWRNQWYPSRPEHRPV
jgi:hypothetical protein